MAASTDVCLTADKTVPISEEETRDESSLGVCGQTNLSIAVVLNQEDRDRLESEKTLVTEFKQMKLEKDAQKNWDLFYKRNTTNFFKDRHWTTREFEELSVCREVRKTTTQYV